MYCIIYKKICNENEQWGMPLISSYYMEFGITYKKTRRTLWLICTPNTGHLVLGVFLWKKKSISYAGGS